MKLAACAFVALSLIASGALAEDDDSCDGRNPLHCEQEAAEAPPASAAEPAVEDEAADDCEGRNPLYCGVTGNDPAEEVVGEDDVLVVPPGGCEGRNPRYCREEAAPPAPAPEARPRKERPDPPSSRNPNRNPNRNPGSGPS